MKLLPQSEYSLQLLSLFSLVAATTDHLPATAFSEVQNKTYDYIIVGGGLSGLVVANRLSEDSTSRSMHEVNRILDNLP